MSKFNHTMPKMVDLWNRDFQMKVGSVTRSYLFVLWALITRMGLWNAKSRI
ncbi:hypothetical protein ACHAXS_003840 [Conticribra weissflogii]